VNDSLSANRKGNQSENGVGNIATARPRAFGGDSANALIWRSGGDGCGFKAVAMSAGGKLTSTPKRENRFTIARPAATKCANGRNSLCGSAERGELLNKKLPCRSNPAG